LNTNASAALAGSSWSRMVLSVSAVLFFCLPSSVSTAAERDGVWSDAPPCFAPAAPDYGAVAAATRPARPSEAAADPAATSLRNSRRDFMVRSSFTRG
jgi:hypothetical protein